MREYRETQLNKHSSGKLKPEALSCSKREGGSRAVHVPACAERFTANCSKQRFSHKASLPDGRTIVNGEWRVGDLIREVLPIASTISKCFETIKPIFKRIDSPMETIGRPQEQYG